MPEGKDETPTSEVKYYWPNKMGRIALLALEDVMGRNGVNAVLNLAKLRHLVNNYPPNNLDLQFSFDEFSAIEQALEDMYGPRGGRGLALRQGRAAFKYALREFGAVLGMADLAFRLLPLGMKMKVGLKLLTNSQIIKSILKRKPIISSGSLNDAPCVGTGNPIYHVVMLQWVFCKKGIIGLAAGGTFILKRLPASPWEILPATSSLTKSHWIRSPFIASRRMKKA
jgi:hypothetical protein